MSENIFAQIPEKTDKQIYCMYTDYEDDFRKTYTTILGCKVSDNLTKVPKGLVSKIIPTDKYTKLVTTGNLQEGAVYKAWVNIWNSDLDRAYHADFEVYGLAAQDPLNASVDIFISVK